MSIRSQVHDGVAVVEIARPERKNAISTQMYGQLAQALLEAGRDAAVHAVLLQGAPEVFCAGNDIHDFLQSTEAGLANARAFMGALEGLEKPAVAAVNGAAVGIGTTLLLHCDLVYAADDAMFSLPFVNLGLCPEFASSLLLPASAGYHRAAEKLLFGEPISAEEALDMGIVNRLLPPASVREYALHQAHRFTALPPESVRQTKRLLKAGWRAAVQQAIGTELEAFTKLVGSAESREALTAFLERRKPDFARVRTEQA